MVWCIRFACENKVYLLFAFLFGYGIALQMMRTDASESHSARLHAWRMVTLFLIGVIHAAIWDGDILMTYSLIGFTLLAIRNFSTRSLLAFGLLFWRSPPSASRPG